MLQVYHLENEYRLRKTVSCIFEPLSNFKKISRICLQLHETIKILHRALSFTQFLSEMNLSSANAISETLYTIHHIQALCSLKGTFMQVPCPRPKEIIWSSLKMLRLPRNPWTRSIKAQSRKRHWRRQHF